jgi:TonB family protein
MARSKEKKQEKILRIGIVQGGRIIEERLLRHKEAITIGQSPKNKFMIPSPRVPIVYKLVDVKGGTYVLCFEKGMLGKILVGEEIMDLKTLAKRRLAVRKDAKFRYPLTEESRGKIVLGDVTLLFQFVTPPPEVPKLQLPAEARGAWWRNMDKAMAAVFMIAFLGLGGTGGGMDFWWRYTGRYLPTVKNAAKPAIFQTLVKAAKAEEKEKEKKDGEEAEKKEEDGIKEDKADEDKVKDDDTAKLEDMAIDESKMTDEGDGSESLDEDMLADAGQGDDIDVSDIADRVNESFKEPEPVRAAPSNMSAADREARAKRLVSNHTVVGMVGSDWGAGEGGFGDSLSNGMARIKDRSNFGEGTLQLGGGGLGSDYLDDGDGLGRIADEMGPGGMPGGMGPGGPGGGPNLAAFKPDVTAPDVGPGKAEVIKGPSKKLEAKKPKVAEKKYKLSLQSGRGFTGGKIDKKAVNKYLRARSSAFNRCYTMVARRNPNVGGKLTLKITIGSNGRATARAVSDKTGDPALGKCIIGKIKQWQFPKPEGKSANFTIPLVFRRL